MIENRVKNPVGLLLPLLHKQALNWQAGFKMDAFEKKRQENDFPVQKIDTQI